MDCFDLNDEIHQFHNGPSRDLWKLNNTTRNNAVLVAIAIVEGYIQKSDVSDNAMQQLESLIQNYEK